MKRVGIFTRIDIHNEKQIHFVPSDIIKKLHNKVIIKLIVFTQDNSFNDIINEVKNCDGIIFPGGDNIYPIELEVIKYLHENNIPTLGICLGMQEMAYVFNGIIDHLPNLSHRSKKNYVHEIYIKPCSLLHHILGRKKIFVNSRHNDYIKTTYLMVSAISSDNIIEAVEDSNKKFFIGVQWHPENLNDEYANRLFDYFVGVL